MNSELLSVECGNALLRICTMLPLIYLARVGFRQPLSAVLCDLKDSSSSSLTEFGCCSVSPFRADASPGTKPLASCSCGVNPLVEKKCRGHARQIPCCGAYPAVAMALGAILWLSSPEGMAICGLQ